jgi:hypothetical protein
VVDEEGHRANSVLIKKHLNPMCQSLLFSATFPDAVVAFASKLVARPDKILIEQGPDALVRYDEECCVAAGLCGFPAVFFFFVDLIACVVLLLCLFGGDRF